MAERAQSDEQQAREEALVRAVMDSFAETPDARLRLVLESLTKHLHAFLRETRLTEEEWRAGIDFLTAAGHITDDRRQEFVLLSDVLGASMQTIAINNEASANATEATVLGPFFVEGAPGVELGGDIAFCARESVLEVVPRVERTRPGLAIVVGDAPASAGAVDAGGNVGAVREPMDSPRPAHATERQPTG